MAPGKRTWPTDLAKRLAGRGPMPFRDYMAEALYAPKHGFYTRRDLRRHAQASPTQDTVYVAGLARQLARLFIPFAEQHQPRLIEQGAGSVKLLRFLLTALPDELVQEMELIVVEPRLARRTRLVAVVQEFGVDGQVVGSPGNLAPGPAFVVAKELVSSFPVHWVEATQDGWQEVTVSFEPDRWAWEEHLAEPPGRVLEALGDAPAEPGTRTEVNLQVDGWLGEVASILDPGLIAVLDRPQGDQASAQGSVEALLDGELVSPYEAPGRVRLSAGVDMARLATRARTHGLARTTPPAGLLEACKPNLAPLLLTAGQ